jgi:hypothetical protein
MLDYRRLSHQFRSKRFILFRQIVDDVLAHKGVCRILDVGGTLEYWQAFGNGLDWSKIKILILNLSFSETNHPSITAIAGDARSMAEFDDLSFDIVHSNSVIEHVGRWNDMVSTASEIRRLAPLYFVQTPYFWFPIEPHARFPLLHWMPESWRYRILLRRSCGFWKKKENVGDAMETIQGAVLLDKLQMQFLFPDAKIIPERLLGLTKSLVAVRRA